MNHGIITEESQTRILQMITPRITALYSEAPNIDPTDQYIFKYSQEELHKQPSHAIKISEVPRY
jgi:hypothetical protein